MESTFKFLLCSTDITDHQIVTRIYHIGYPIENPERRIPRESDIIGSTYTGIAYRHFIRTAVYRGEYRHIGIVRTKPKYTTHRIGHTGTHLRNKNKTGLLSGNRALIEIFLITHFKRKRRKTIWDLIRAGTKIIADIEGSPFIVITHGILYILYGNLTVRLHEQRHRFVCFSLYIRKVCLSLIGKHIEITPDTGFTITAGTEIKWSICLGKAEVLIHPIKISLFAGKRNHVRRIKTILLIVHIKLLDTRLVGMSRDTIIGHAYSHPYGTTYTGTFTDHLHNPYFIGIGNGKRLSFAIIAIFLYKVSHNPNGLTSCTRTLQTDIYKAAIIDNPGRIC